MATLEQFSKHASEIQQCFERAEAYWEEMQGSLEQLSWDRAAEVLHTAQAGYADVLKLHKTHRRSRHRSEEIRTLQSRVDAKAEAAMEQFGAMLIKLCEYSPGARKAIIDFVTKTQQRLEGLARQRSVMPQASVYNPASTVDPVPRRRY